MSRYIDADNLLKDETENGAWSLGAILRIKREPTADVAPVVHAHWIPNIWDLGGFDGSYRCSQCGGEWNTEHDKPFEESLPNYCPDCGAKMDEVTEKG